MIPNTLFSSGTDTDITSAPVLMCLKSETLAPYSSMVSTFTNSYLARTGALNGRVSTGLVATIFKRRGENDLTLPDPLTIGEMALDRCNEESNLHPEL